VVTWDLSFVHQGTLYFVQVFVSFFSLIEPGYKLCSWNLISKTKQEVTLFIRPQNTQNKPNSQVISTLKLHYIDTAAGHSTRKFVLVL
jgi:hypothetical protein